MNLPKCRHCNMSFDMTMADPVPDAASCETTRSSGGCWTCRVRRKKCDEQRPVCKICASLHVTCHYSADRPAWMDGAVKQEEMAERLKREVKEQAIRHSRYGADHVVGGGISVSPNTSSPLNRHGLPRNMASSTCDMLETTTNSGHQRRSTEQGHVFGSKRVEPTHELAGEEAHQSTALERSDTVLLMFHLEHCLPFLFPFYRPPLTEGGRAWILEMMIKSPVVREATLCQSSYFFSLVRTPREHRAACPTVYSQVKAAFSTLRRALQVISDSDITKHLPGAVRVLASIMQMQRFEIAISSFENCRAHLTGAVALFKRLLNCQAVAHLSDSKARFNKVMSKLGPSLRIHPSGSCPICSAEQSAFTFSTALLLIDDIIASTVLQEQPRLLEYHSSLLTSADSEACCIDLEAVVGCQNWVFVLIGQIATLDAGKQVCKQAGDLDVMELVQRATVIKKTLTHCLANVENAPPKPKAEGSILLDVLTPEYCQSVRAHANQKSMVTCVWAHAALCYLFVVVSGWQPGSAEVRYHVERIIELISHEMSPPTLLRTMAWPFCIAGCLADRTQEGRLRVMLEKLQPKEVFGTVQKAFKIMENVWQDKDSLTTTSRDLAMCFRSQEELALLV